MNMMDTVKNKPPIGFNEYISEWSQRQIDNAEIVSSKEYINWLVNFIETKTLKGFIDDYYLYDIELDKKDKENVFRLQYFVDYVISKASEQRVLSVVDEDNYFDTINYAIRIYDKFYEISETHGQGTYSAIMVMDSEPNYSYVKIT